MDLVYHESQVGRMCAQHALNMLLQGQYFTIDGLSAIARELDQRERAVLNDEARQPSENYDDSGYFSIQVITEALRRQANLNLEPLDSPQVLKIRQNPSLGQAYICHQDDHWFTVRKIGTTWFVLNSLLKAPRVVSESFMELYITQLYTEGWTIYVVEGQLPSCAAESVPREYWQEARRSRKFESDLEKAIALSLNEAASPFIAQNTQEEGTIPHSTSTSTLNQAEEFDIQRALEESLREANRLQSINSAESSLMQNAMKESLNDAQAGTSSSSRPPEPEDDKNYDPTKHPSSSNDIKK